MESVQCVRNEEISVELSVEEKASLDAIVKQAEFSLESQELLDQSIGVVAENESLDKAALKNQTKGPQTVMTIKIHILAGALKNLTGGPLTVMATKKYAGQIVKDFPSSFVNTGAFAMSELVSWFSPPKGFKAAVVYSGKNKAGVECAWLLAFADTKATGRRIYVECGRKSKFSNINWAEVEHKLNNAGAVAKPHDIETGTSLYAAITGRADDSAVGAAFLG